MQGGKVSRAPTHIGTRNGCIYSSLYRPNESKPIRRSFWLPIHIIKALVLKTLNIHFLQPGENVFG